MLYIWVIVFSIQNRICKAILEGFPCKITGWPDLSAEVAINWPGLLLMARGFHQLIGGFIFSNDSMILEVSYIPNGAGLDRHQQLWPSGPQIWVRQLAKVSYDWKNWRCVDPPWCQSDPSYDWYAFTKAVHELHKRNAESRPWNLAWLKGGFPWRATTIPAQIHHIHHFKAKMILFLLEGWNNCQSQPDFSAATLHWFHLENGLHQSTSIWHNEIQM